MKNEKKLCALNRISNHFLSQENYGIFDSKEKALDKAEQIIKANLNNVENYQAEYQTMSTNLELCSSKVNESANETTYYVGYNPSQKKVFLSKKEI